jgi:sugar/nucleoside kinase (ribokinase family)
MKIKTPILGVGSPLLDLLINVNDAFIDSIEGDKGGMNLVSTDQMTDLVAKAGNPHRAPGGSAGNTIFGLARLNTPASFLGMIGDDEDGEFYKTRLVELGGDDSRFQVNPACHTGRCLCLITPDSERTMRTDLGASGLITAADVTSDIFTDIGHVHLEGYSLFNRDFAKQLMVEAKAANCTVSLDLASFEVVAANRDVLPELLENYIDIVFANEDEAREFCGDLTPEEQAAELCKYCSVAAVKLGKEGCCLLEKGGEPVRVSANVVEAVDTTGAGDLWQTGFLYGLAKGASLEDCARYGAIISAEVVQIIGADISDERWEVIHQGIAKI